MNAAAQAEPGNTFPDKERLPSHGWAENLVWMLVAVLAFQGAYGFAHGGFLMLVYLFALLRLAQASSWRQTLYPALGVGLLNAAFTLGFFYRIFSFGAVALWMVYAFWIAVFVSLTRLSLRRFGLKWGWLPVPFLWLGVEYFRSELYYLRFSWLNSGYAFADAAQKLPLTLFGMYGVGFGMVALAVGLAWLWRRSKAQSTVLFLVALAGIWGIQRTHISGVPQDIAREVKVTGIQLEFPYENDVILALTAAFHKQPETQIFVLSEYTLQDMPSDRIKRWCREHNRHLIVGGTEPAPGGGYYNTAFVIGPSGEIVFRQVKSVPIQFFKDGKPAPEQKVWASPWGRIGICICYDLSYTRVTDGLIGQGAQALIVPTMDVADWGAAQHELHGHVAPVRAAEYDVPIFRLASSGISQSVDRFGRVEASAPFPGEGAVMNATLRLAAPGKLPWDRWLAPASAAFSGLMIVWFTVGWLRGKRRRHAAVSPAQNQSANLPPSPQAVSP